MKLCSMSVAAVCRQIGDPSLPPSEEPSGNGIGPVRFAGVRQGRSSAGDATAGGLPADPWGRMRIAIPQRTAAPKRLWYRSAKRDRGARLQVQKKGRCETEAMPCRSDLDEGLRYAYPRTFSGGEKPRLNLAAATIKEPRLLLLDESTASLGNASKAEGANSSSA